MFVIRPLEKADTDRGFTCGVKALDDFLARRAWAHHEKHRANRVYVLVDDESGAVLGFHTLSVRELERSRLDGVVPGSSPPHPLGVFYLGFFAVASAHQGKGLGRRLMGDALRRCAAGAESFGSVGVYLDSLDARSTAFYRSLGFVEIPRAANAPEVGPQPMFLPMSVLLAARRGAPGSLD